MVSISYYLIMYTKLTAALIGAKLTVLTFGLSREARSSSLREYFSWRYTAPTPIVVSRLQWRLSTKL